jgi:phosphatidylglycerophosphatase A
MLWKELLFTGFYSGYIPAASGTAGTLLAALIFVVEYLIFGSSAVIANFVIVLIMIYPSFKLGDAGEVFFKQKDPSEVVLDEMMGYWISVLFLPFNLKIVILAFIVFRLTDIIKPYPIKKFEKLKGGYGIMLDDFAAGIYTNIIIRILIFMSGLAGLKIC